MRSLLVTAVSVSAAVVLGWSEPAGAVGGADAPGDLAADPGRRPAGLMGAINYGDAERVRLLLEMGVSPNAKASAAAWSYGGVSPLFLAVEKGNTEIARLLMEGGADVNEIAEPAAVAGRAAGTPLMAAASRGDAEMVELLLRHGADASAEVGETAQYNAGVSALLLAAAKGHSGIVDILNRESTAGEWLWKYMVIALWCLLWFPILARGRCIFIRIRIRNRNPLRNPD